MPVRRRLIGAADPGAFRGLADELARELAHPNPFGQPHIHTRTLGRTGFLVVTLIWDRWNRVPRERRPGVILAAYETARGEDGKNRVAFTFGLTYREAIDLGKLPFAVVPRLRRADPVTPEQARDAMRELGGVVLGAADGPVALRFPTREDAEACRAKLVERLPGTDEAWEVYEEPPDRAWE